MHGEVFIEPPNEELLQGVDRTTVRPQLVFGLVFFSYFAFVVFKKQFNSTGVQPGIAFSLCLTHAVQQTGVAWGIKQSRCILFILSKC